MRIQRSEDLMETNCWMTVDVNEIKRENDLHSEDQSEVVAYLKRQSEPSKVGIERFKSSDDDIFSSFVVLYHSR